jgi:hypothetical protein
MAEGPESLVQNPRVDLSGRMPNDNVAIPTFHQGWWEQRFYKVFTKVKSAGRFSNVKRFPSEDLYVTFPLPACQENVKPRLPSSEEKHQSNDRTFHGQFQHIRQKLDYNYHSNYTPERQKFQDEVVNSFLGRACISDENGETSATPTEPWIVFTAGAMGVGKGYTMNKLVEMDQFPAFVQVDPDEIRRHFPEIQEYLEQCPELAGELTKKEAGFISEILTLAGLQAGKNVLVDGSLRDWEWYQVYFHQLRTEFPNFRLAILHISAPRDTVLQRAEVRLKGKHMQLFVIPTGSNEFYLHTVYKERARSTGRSVPHELLVSTLEQVPMSVQKLAPLVDYHAEFSNGADLVLLNDSWESFQKKWVQ